MTGALNCTQNTIPSKMFTYEDIYGRDTNYSLCFKFEIKFFEIKNTKSIKSCIKKFCDYSLSGGRPIFKLERNKSSHKVWKDEKYIYITLKYSQILTKFKR